MAAKFFVVACASALLVNIIAGCPTGASWRSSAINSIGGCGYGLGGARNLVAYDNGGCLNVAVGSPIAPTGLSILSENVIDGCLDVKGAAPLLAAVAFEGTVPSSGSAGAAYSCGNGNVGISAESLAAAGLAPGASRVGRIGRIGAGRNAANIAAANYNAANIGSSYGCGIC